MSEERWAAWQGLFQRTEELEEQIIRQAYPELNLENVFYSQKSKMAYFQDGSVPEHDERWIEVEISPLTIQEAQEHYYKLQK